MRFLVGTAILLLAALLPVLRAQLSTKEKQLALDVHNDLRGEEAMLQGVTNMREMQWDEGLADTARNHASGCYFDREQIGQNLYIKMAESVTMLEVIEQWYSEGDGAGGCGDGVDSCDNYTRIVSAITYRLGCDSALCPNLALPGGGRMTDVTLVVCNYAPADLSTPVYSTTADCPPHTHQLGELGTRGTLCVSSDRPPVIYPGAGNLNNIVKRSDDEMEQNVSSLAVLQQPANGTEGLPLSQQPVVAVIDDDWEIVQNLARSSPQLEGSGSTMIFVGMPWVLTATIEAGPDGAFITENVVNFTTDGRAYFTNLTLSHPGNYSLTFTVTYPPGANLSVMSEPFTVTQRQLQLAIATQPQDGNTTRLLFPYPAVQINDLETDEVLTDPDWRNREWYVTASIEGVEDTWRAPLVDGEALFTEIAISQSGMYQIQFSASTEPSSPPSQIPSPVFSDQFTIEQLPLTRVISTYDGDFDDVVGDDVTSFTNSFVAQIQPRYPDIEIFDVNATAGSIIISFFATASNLSELVSFVNEVTSNNSALSFTFNGSLLTPVSIVQDPEFPLPEATATPTQTTTEATSPTSLPTQMTTTQDNKDLILGTTIPGSIIILLAILIIVAALLIQRHHKKTKKLNITVPREVPQNLEVSSQEDESMEEFTLQGLDNKETELSEPDVEVVVSTFVFTNPAATEATDTETGNLDLQDSLEQIFNRNGSADNNNNDNNNNDSNVDFSPEHTSYRLAHAN